MAELHPGDPGDENPGRAAPGPGPNGESGGAAAPESHDFTQTEGNPTEHAVLKVKRGEDSYSINLKLSSYVYIPTIAMALIGGVLFFAYEMRDNSYIGWILLGAGIFGMIILGTAWRFATKLINPRKPDNQPPPTVNLRRYTPHNTTEQQVKRNKTKKSRKKNHRRRR